MNHLPIPSKQGKIEKVLELPYGKKILDAFPLLEVKPEEQGKFKHLTEDDPLYREIQTVLRILLL